MVRVTVIEGTSPWQRPQRLRRACGAQLSPGDARAERCLEKRRLRAGAVLISLMLTSVLTGCGSTKPSEGTRSTLPLEPSSHAKPSVLTIDSLQAGRRIPEGFVGLSIEADQLGTPLLTPGESDLPVYLSQLGTGDLRIGGNSVDEVAWEPSPGSTPPSWARAVVTPGDLDSLGKIVSDSGFKVDLGLGLAHFDAMAAAAEALAAERDLGKHLRAVEIGNEPDAYQKHSPHLGDYPYSRFIDEFNSYRVAITAGAPGVRIAGPETAQPEWLNSFANQDGAGLDHLTQHFYPLAGCSGTPTINDLLGPETAQSEEFVISEALAAASLRALPVILDEVNSVSCGGQPGVSDSFASTLWVVDMLLRAAAGGISGVDIQVDPSQCEGYTPLCAPDPRAPGRLVERPIYSGMLLVRQLEGSYMLPEGSMSFSSRAPGVTFYGVGMPDGSIAICIINTSSHPIANLVFAPGEVVKTMRVMRLSAPSLASTGPVDVAQWAYRVADDGRPWVTASAASIELVTLAP